MLMFYGLWMYDKSYFYNTYIDIKNIVLFKHYIFFYRRLKFVQNMIIMNICTLNETKHFWENVEPIFLNILVLYFLSYYTETIVTDNNLFKTIITDK